MTDEKTFYSGPGVSVTSARLVVENKTYALSSVSSVKVNSTDITQSNTLPGICIIFGGIWLLMNIVSGSSSTFNYLTSIALLGGGIYWWRSIRKKIRFELILTTTAGEQQALVSENGDEILPVESALIEAIVYRG
jgi:Family of unknown function (DUF6232)